MYIQSLCCISPSGMLINDLSGLEPLSGDLLSCREPEYKNLIPPMQLRRMSKTLRIGVASAKICLQEAGLDKPEAIHVGTAYGVLDDSEKFLNNLILQEEQTLTPTSFIQSTHNTVSGQIALNTGCHAHNLTFVHKAHSFESALLDASVFLQEQPQAFVLAGAVDECTPTAFDILRRFGMYDDQTSAGEGAAFFLLSNQASNARCKIEAFDMFLAGDITAVSAQITSFLKRSSGNITEGDLIITGALANEASATMYRQLQETFFPKNRVKTFKEYCGEFPTASAFGLAYAALSLHEENRRAWLINNLGKYWAIYCLEAVKP